MTRRFFFMAGLPRSGSTLLCNILMQNPLIYASATSGIAEVLRGIRDGWDLVSPFKAMPAAESRAALLGTLRGALNGYYERVDHPVVVDRSRAWPVYIEMLEAMNVAPKILCCVRDMRDVVASFELLHRRTVATGLTTQQRADAAAFGSLQSRCDLWVRGDQPVGAAYNAMQDAIARGHRDKLHFVRYEELTAQPAVTLAGVYAFLGLEPFPHDFEQVAQVTVEDDRVHGFDGLHDIAMKVEPRPPRWPTVLGRVAERYQGQEFW